MPRKDSISCTIAIPGSRLIEYPPNPFDREVGFSNPSAITTYVESTPDTSFSVHIFFNAGYDEQLELASTGTTHLIANVTVDGFEIKASSTSPNISREVTPQGWKIAMRTWNPATEKPELIMLRFAERSKESSATVGGNVFEAGEKQKQQPDEARLGEIVIKLWRYRMTGITTCEFKDEVDMGKEAVTMLKARNVVHAVELKTETPKVKQLSGVMKGYYVDRHAHTPFLTFRFLYRSRATLEALDIIPRAVTTADELTETLTGLAINRRRGFGDFSEEEKTSTTATATANAKASSSAPAPAAHAPSASEIADSLAALEISHPPKRVRQEDVPVIPDPDDLYA